MPSTLIIKSTAALPESAASSFGTDSILNDFNPTQIRRNSAPKTNSEYLDRWLSKRKASGAKAAQSKSAYRK